MDEEEDKNEIVEDIRNLADEISDSAEFWSYYPNLYNWTIDDLKGLRDSLVESAKVIPDVSLKQKQKIDEEVL